MWFGIVLATNGIFYYQKNKQLEKFKVLNDQIGGQLVSNVKLVCGLSNDLKNGNVLTEAEFKAIVEKAVQGGAALSTTYTISGISQEDADLMNNVIVAKNTPKGISVTSNNFDITELDSNVHAVLDDYFVLKSKKEELLKANHAFFKNQNLKAMWVVCLGLTAGFSSAESDGIDRIKKLSVITEIDKVYNNIQKIYDAEITNKTVEVVSLTQKIADYKTIQSKNNFSDAFNDKNTFETAKGFFVEVIDKMKENDVANVKKTHGDNESNINLLNLYKGAVVALNKLNSGDPGNANAIIAVLKDQKGQFGKERFENLCEHVFKEDVIGKLPKYKDIVPHEKEINEVMTYVTEPKFNDFAKAIKDRQTVDSVSSNDLTDYIKNYKVNDKLIQDGKIATQNLVIEQQKVQQAQNDLNIEQQNFGNYETKVVDIIGKMLNDNKGDLLERFKWMAGHCGIGLQDQSNDKTADQLKAEIEAHFKK